MGKYKVLDIFSFLPANVISLEQLEKMFLDSLSEISNNTKLGNEEIVVTCSSQSWFTENIKECSALKLQMVGFLEGIAQEEIEMSRARIEVPQLENMVGAGKKKFVRLGLHTFQEIAKEANAVDKVKRCVLVNTEKVDEYLENFCECQN